MLELTNCPIAVAAAAAAAIAAHVGLLLLLQDAAIAGPACVTASDGSCIIDLAAAAKAKKQQQQQQQAKAASGGSNSGSSGNSAFQPTEEVGSYSAVITAKGHGPLVVPDVPNSARYSSSSGASKEYVATLVLDRKLVKPGDDLHVTGVRVCVCFVYGFRGGSLCTPAA